MLWIMPCWDHWTGVLSTHIGAALACAKVGTSKPPCAMLEALTEPFSLKTALETWFNDDPLNLTVVGQAQQVGSSQSKSQ